MEKDSLIQEAAGENNSLKEQLRSLLIQTDNLHAEKAKLSAELHGHRDQLTQVLSMKDLQHKQQLAAQRERINSLERQRRELESQLAVVNNARETQGEAGRVERELLSRAAAKDVYAPGAEVEKLREQLQAARLQAQALEETLQKERNEHESKSKELAHLQWEGGVMRTESETAQERVAELARDLLAVEQRLMEEKEATTQLRAENESFAKAMVSLQDSRDQAVDRVQELTLKVAELSKAGGHVAHSPSAGPAGEVWGLKNALQALQNDRERLVSSATDSARASAQLFSKAPLSAAGADPGADVRAEQAKVPAGSAGCRRAHQGQPAALGRENQEREDAGRHEAAGEPGGNGQAGDRGAQVRLSLPARLVLGDARCIQPFVCAVPGWNASTGWLNPSS